MAAGPDPGGPRLLGRITDPSVREDGVPEPEVELEPEQATARAGRDGAGERADATPTRGPEVRERLLERARRHRDRGSAASAGLDEIGQHDGGPLSALEGELDRIAPSRRAPSAPVPGLRAPLSPNLVAVFGALLGLATIATIVAVLIQLDPRRSSPPSPPSESSAPEAVADPAPAPPPVLRTRKKIPGPWRIADAKGEPGGRILQGTIGRAPFLKVIQDAGLQKAQAYRALTALKGLRNLDKCGPNDQFIALVDRSSKRLKAFEYVVSKEEVYQAKENPTSGLLESSKLNLERRVEQWSAAFLLDGESFTESAKQVGFESGIDDVVGRALEGFTSIAMMRKGDRLRVIAQEVTVLGEFARYAGVEAIEYVPADPKEEPLRIYYFRGPKSRGYFDAKGRSLHEGGWRSPIKGAPITSRFNPKRLHPVLKKVMPHNGTDFGAPAGTPIRASSFGVVSFLGWAGASGNLVKVEHPGGVETGYAHCSRFEDGLALGDKVKSLQVLAYVGSTGRSTGPHLHFSVQRDGKFIDPESLHLDSMTLLPTDDRALFAAHKAKYDGLLDAIPLPAALPAEQTAPREEPTETVYDPMDEGDGGLAEPLPSGPAAAAAQPPAASSPAAAPRPASPGSAVYLTDKELLERQRVVDDGEVEE